MSALYGWLLIVGISFFVYMLVKRPWWTWLKFGELAVLLSYPLASAGRRKFLRGLMLERRADDTARRAAAALAVPERRRAGLKVGGSVRASFSLQVGRGLEPPREPPTFSPAPLGVDGKDWDGEGAHSCAHDCAVGRFGASRAHEARIVSAFGIPPAQAGTASLARLAHDAGITDRGSVLPELEFSRRQAAAVQATAHEAHAAHAAHLERLASDEDRRAAGARFPQPLTIDDLVPRRQPAARVVRGPGHSAQAAGPVPEEEL